MNGFGTQLKHVLRRLMRSPMFTVVTLLTIAIGVGANSAIFSVINGVLLKPLPYPDPERLVGIWQTAPGLDIKDLNASPSDYFTFREENRTFQHFDVARYCLGANIWDRLALVHGIDCAFGDNLLAVLQPARFDRHEFIGRTSARPSTRGFCSFPTTFSRAPARNGVEMLRNFAFRLL